MAWLGLLGLGQGLLGTHSQAVGNELSPLLLFPGDLNSVQTDIFQEFLEYCQGWLSS